MKKKWILKQEQVKCGNAFMIDSQKLTSYKTNKGLKDRPIREGTDVVKNTY